MLVMDSWLAVDVREGDERRKIGTIANSLHAPYDQLDAYLCEQKSIYQKARKAGKKLLFYCAYGERSAMAVERAHELGWERSCHMIGGIDAWKRLGGPLIKSD